MPVFEPSFDLQKAIRGRLLASADLMAMVPADSIIDTTGRPERVPCVNIGEGQTIYRRFDATSHATLHVWAQEAGLTISKQIASAIIDALTVDAQASGALMLDHFLCHDMRVTQTHFMRDPHGNLSHGIVNLAAIVQAR